MIIRRLIVVSAILLACSGCHWGKQAKAPSAPAREVVETGSREPAGEGIAAVAPRSEGKTGITETAGAPSTWIASQPPAAPPEEKPQAPEAKSSPAVPATVADSDESKQASAENKDDDKNRSISSSDARRAKKSAEADPADVPEWARGNEELVYRVEFLGMTMGYARFTFKGKVSWNGRQTYHLSVRAWTSDVLSVIYPINDTIDYYLDMKTLAPLRQEYSGRVKGKEDVATFDQENGKIVYRHKSTGEIRKKVDAPPNVYDPVTAAYYFRARDFGAEERPRNVYAGRKLWKISPKTIGHEKIDTTGGPVETVVIQPVLMRDGKLESKGEFKMWVTNDARHVPVRIYAKFKKIRMWTLLAELVPAREGG